MIRSWHYILLLSLCLIIFFFRLGAIPLIGADEGYYAECSREMLISGNYIVPMCNGEHFFDKPPLSFWLQAGSMAIFGINSFAARIPSAIEALFLIFFTAYLGKRLFNAKTGLIAAFMLATSTLIAVVARMAILDMAFTLAITLSLGSFILAYLQLWPRWGYLLFWAALGFSILIKGPAGAVLIGLSVAAFLILQKDIKAIIKTLPLPGILICSAIALPWYILVEKSTNGAFLREFIIHQNLQRAAGLDFHHNQPFFFYFIIILAGFFPWSAYLPLSWSKNVRIFTKSNSEKASLFLGVWASVIFIVFSLLRSKLPGYIVPMLPAAALIAAVFWAEAIDKQDSFDFRALRKYSTGALILSALLGGAFLTSKYFLPNPIPGLKLVLIIMGLSLITGSTAASILIYRKKITAAFIAICVYMTVFHISVINLGLPIASEKLSAPIVKTATFISKKAPAGASVFGYRLSPPPCSLSFYSGRLVSPIKDKIELQKRLMCSSISFVIAKKTHVKELPKEGKLLVRYGDYFLYEYK